MFVWKRTWKNKRLVILIEEGGERREAMLRISNSAICGIVEEETEYNCDRGDLRCGCGSLLARLNPKGIELKCRRCKRIIVIPLSIENSKKQKRRDL